MRPMKGLGVVAIVTAGACLLPTSAHADIVRGIADVITGVFQVPLSTLAGTFNGPPVLGTLLGAINGTVNGLGLVVRGALELAASGVSVAKTVGPYLIPIFL